MEKIMLDDLLCAYPKPEQTVIDAMLKRELEQNNKKIIVLDDDPTGIQTVHDVTVITDWEKDSIKSAFEEQGNMFFILTNSRSFTVEQTESVHAEIAENIVAAANELNRDYMIISRGDSTLRGHYPLETQVLRKTIASKTKMDFDGEIICPFFQEGGRYTANNIHYVNEGGVLTPCGETEFAGDKTFGYRSSHLGEWIEEKTLGACRKEQVTYISLEELRAVDVEGILTKLLAVKDFQKVVVNAIDYSDIKVFCIALYRAMKRKRFLFRTAASFVKELGGVQDAPLLTYGQLIRKNRDKGGLIIAGSHTKKTTAQLAELEQCANVVTVVFNQHLVMEPDEVFQNEIRRVCGACMKYLNENKTVCVCTRRERFDLNTDNKEDELRIAVKISNAITQIVSDLEVAPSFIIAKGGITSSDVGTKALGVRRAVAAGQIKPGIPVWICGSESKFPAMPYIIFPGNVGEPTALLEIVQLLTEGRKDEKSCEK